MQENASTVGVWLVVDAFYGFFSDRKKDGIEYLPISQWITQEFSPDDALHVTNKLGDWTFFKSYEQTGLNNLEFLEFLEKSLRSKKDINIYDVVVDKLKKIAPTEYDCDPDLYAVDSHYRVWFLLRESFFLTLHDAINHPEDRYLVWDALSDNRSHQDCLDLHKKVFVIGKEFIDIAEQHWSKARSGCRCNLSALTKRQLDRCELKAP